MRHVVGKTISSLQRFALSTQQNRDVYPIGDTLLDTKKETHAVLQNKTQLEKRRKTKNETVEKKPPTR